MRHIRTVARALFFARPSTRQTIIASHRACFAAAQSGASPRALLFLALLIAAPINVFGADHFLTIGGGDRQGNNQVSLEKNVLYLRRCLADHGLGALPNEVLFTDGAGGSRDLEFDDPQFKPPKAREMLAAVMGMEDGLWTQYRPHNIPQLWGPSGRKGLTNWFDTVGKNLADTDRLIIYFTGHGGHGKGPHNATLSMWNEQGMSVSEFVGLLDRVPERVPVVLVMVQCYSGCFADVIYNSGDPAKGFSAHNRCGFFATSPDRMAAGCTPDVDEESYKDYTTYFWAGLFGEKRSGEAVPPPDFNGDGAVSLDEAHAYALINNDTIDLSMKTSDNLLRQFSKLTPGTAAAGGISVDADYDQLAARAAPTDRAVLDGLSRQLDFDGKSRMSQARNMIRGLELRRKQADETKHRAEKSRDDLRTALEKSLKSRWPELGNLLSPIAADLLAKHGPELVAAMEGLPHWQEFQDRRDEIDKLDDESTELEKKWVKCQRFIQTTERVVLASNLPSYATPEVQQHFQQLLEAEGGFIGHGSGQAPATQPVHLLLPATRPPSTLPAVSPREGP